jgi:hypothetical protein
VVLPKTDLGSVTKGDQKHERTGVLPEANELKALLVESRLVVTPPPGGETRVAWLRRNTVESAHFSRNVVALAGDNNEVHIRARYRVSAVHIDTDSFEQDLSVRSKAALREFVKNPGSFEACRKFQAALPRGPASLIEQGSQEYEAARQTKASINNCRIAVIGDNNSTIVKPDYHAPTGNLNFTELLWKDVGLAMAFARHLGQPDDAAERRRFNIQLARSITQDDLQSLLDSTDFGTGNANLRGVGGSVRVSDANAVTLGQGNKTYSVLEVRACKISPVDAAKLEMGFAAEVHAQDHGSQSPMASTQHVRALRMVLELSVLWWQSAWRSVREVLEELRKRRRSRGARR